MTDSLITPLRPHSTFLRDNSRQTKLALYINEPLPFTCAILSGGPFRFTGNCFPQIIKIITQKNQRIALSEEGKKELRLVFEKLGLLEEQKIKFRFGLTLTFCCRIVNKVDKKQTIPL